MSFEIVTGSKRQSGNALLVVLMFTAALLSLGAYAALQARMDLLIQKQITGAVQGFYVAESGLEHALAEVRINPWFDRLLSGPDGVSGTADDSRFPFRNAPADYFPRPPTRYEVTVEARGSDAAEITSRARTAAEAQQVVAATLTRSDDPFLPGALYSEADALSVTLGPNFSLDGGGSDDPGARAGFALGDQSTVDGVLPDLDSASPRVTGLGDEPSLIAAPFPSISELASTLLENPRARRVDGTLSGAFGYGLVVSNAPLVVTDADGAGVLVVQGDLRVEGEFSFSGLVIVLGNVVVPLGSRMEVHGGLLQAGDYRRIDLLGAGAIHYDQEIVLRVDSDFGARLPRKAVVTGWREVS
jgi:hypothetical protein